MANCQDGSRRKLSAREASQHGAQDRLARPGDATASVHGGPIRIMRLAQVLDVTGLGKTKIYELQSQGDFPMRVGITAHSVGWIEAEVQAWIARRIAVRPAARAAHIGARLPIEPSRSR